jgi:hypothetical protein
MNKILARRSVERRKRERGDSLADTIVRDLLATTAGFLLAIAVVIAAVAVLAPN